MTSRPKPTFQELYPGYPEPDFEPLEFRRYSAEYRRRAHDFYQEMKARRTTRHLSSEAVPQELIELAVRTAGTGWVQYQDSSSS